MLDLAQIEGFDWDEGNNRKSVEKHDVSQAEAKQSFSTTRYWSSRMLATVCANSDCRLLGMPGGCFTSASRCAVMASLSE